MNEVFLINPPLYYQGFKPEALDVSYPPLGILYLAAVLEKKGIGVRAIDVGAQNQRLTETIKLIKREKPVIVGISSMTPTLQGAVTLAQAIKKKCDCRISLGLGGSHISADPEFIKRVKGFDFGVLGEGEGIFPDLVKKALTGKKIKGIHAGQPVENLDSLPWPVRHLLKEAKYLKRASMIATRGCPFHCYYCSRPAVSDRVRCRHPEDIVNEMESLYLACGGEYLFQDDSFTLRKDHTTRLCEEMLRRKRKFRWAAYTRVDLVNEKLLALMAKAGCYSLTFGIESGNEDLRIKVIGKNFTNQQVIKILKLCGKYKIEADGFFMFGHPTETPGQVKETISFILKNNFNIIGVSIATPFPGSKLWDYAVKAGIIDFDFIDQFARGEKGKGYAGVYPVYVPKSLDLDWLYKQRQKIMRGFYLRPRYILKRLIRDISSPSRLKQDFIEGINVLAKGSSARAPYQKKAG